MTKQTISNIAAQLAERLLELGDEPAIGPCHRIQFKLKTRDDDPHLDEGDGGGMNLHALHSWFSRQLQDLLDETK